jgi:hypothetical protein
MLTLLMAGAPLTVDARPRLAQASAGTTVRQPPSWAKHDWQRRRPWSHGWYGIGWQNNVPTWGWWPPQSAAWGLPNLAAAAEINRAVTKAIDAKQATITVADSSDQLVYGSLTVPSDRQVTFVVVRNGERFSMTADCKNGRLNGSDPNSTAAAQLLHAACQVAFGPG